MANPFKPRPAEGTVLVLGLGRFGIACARRLQELGMDVLGVDADLGLVNRYVDTLQHVVKMDSTDADALRQLGLDNISIAIVSMANLESSIITVLTLKEEGVPEVWAKASSRKHGEILKRIGADHIVYPEKSAGERVAHTVAGHLIDYFEFEDGFALARTLAPAFAWGRPLAASAIRTRHNITVIGLKRAGEDFIYADPETTILEGDELIVSGTKRDIDRFARIT
ncbi:MAG: TrkA family potassium uptake protein [Propionibacteriaceae bacterium]|nr:TrkA family potassium uptake protein [Propionibacteriaceae bacterium]